MPLQQIHDFFDPKTYRVCTLEPNYFNMHRLDNSGAHLKIGYRTSECKIYISAYYNARRREQYYNAYAEREAILNRCRSSRDWGSLCETLNVKPQNWQGEWHTLSDNPTKNQQAYCQFMFDNPFPNGRLTKEFLDAIRQLADIIIANFP